MYALLVVAVVIVVAVEFLLMPVALILAVLYWFAGNHEMSSLMFYSWVIVSLFCLASYIVYIVFTTRRGGA